MRAASAYSITSLIGERERRRSISDTIGRALSRGAWGVQCSRAKEDGAYMSSGGVEATIAKARVGKKECCQGGRGWFQFQKDSTFIAFDMT